jgi:hypothetical protein
LAGQVLASFRLALARFAKPGEVINNSLNEKWLVPEFHMVEAIRDDLPAITGRKPKGNVLPHQLVSD